MSAQHEPRPWTRALLGNATAMLVLLATAVFARSLHGDDWELATAPWRWSMAGLLALGYALLFGLATRRSREPILSLAAAAAAQPGHILVAFASQTGYARQLAERTAGSLRAAGLPASLAAIDALDLEVLSLTRRALFVSSTTGEGDPPDHAMRWFGQLVSRNHDLSGLEYAVLALGDRSYARFCAFGHQLDHWLRLHGARPLFDLVEVDNADAGALRHWQHHLAHLGGVAEAADWSPPQYARWWLRERRLLNPGSAGGPVYHLALTPGEDTPREWQAGDIAEVGPCHPAPQVLAWLQAAGIAPDARVFDAQGVAREWSTLLSGSTLPTIHPGVVVEPERLAATLQPLPHREYSIASIPGDGTLQLLLRRMVRPDGTPGVGSGWLCDQAAIGGAIALRIRSNPNFHPPQAARPMILVGNGTGIAGLRAHIKARATISGTRNWLLFGERNRACDFLHESEIRRWQDQGVLERVDLAFSRDGHPHRYVQDCLLAAADALRAWHQAGASIYVCGSLAGMAPGVDAALRVVLGADAVEDMRMQGRYRRDVY